MSLGHHGSGGSRLSLMRLLQPSNETTSFNAAEPTSHFSNDRFRFKIYSTFVCIPKKNFETFFRTYIPVFDILLVAVIPFSLLCFTNTGIIIYTMRANRRMRQCRRSSHRRHQRLTIMLLSVTLAFIGLTCPSVLFICMNKIIYARPIRSDRRGNESLGGPPTNVQLMIEVCEALWYTKHAMNFLLYTLSGQDFRREFVKLFPACCIRPVILVRKLLWKTRTASGPIHDAPLSVSDARRQVVHGTNSKRPLISEAPDTSSVLLTKSNSVQFRLLPDDHRGVPF